MGTTGSTSAARDQEDAGAVIAPRLHHLFLKTVRLTEMKAWYALVLGLKPNFEWEAGAFMSNDDANHRVVLFQSPAVSEDVGKVAHAGLHHTAWEYAAGDDLLQTYARLKRHGIEPHAALDHGLTTSFYYLDPDGNSVELQYDNFGNWAESTAFMRTAAEFAEDPIGKPIDPEAIAIARERGESLASIHVRAYAGEIPPVGSFDIRIPG